VSPKALRRAALAIVTLSAAALALSSGVVGNTTALFNGETQNAASTFAGGWVDAPAALVSTPSGYDVTFSWTPGTHGPVTGQQLTGVDNGTSSDCTGAAYTLISTLPAATNSYTDSSSGSATNNGDWFCYELVSTSATVWTAQLDQVLQLGLVANGLSTSNAAGRCGGAPATASGKIDCNDKIVITFNQKPILPASPIKVCVWATGTIVIGDTQATCAASTDAYSVGKLTGGTLGSNVAYTSSAFTLSASAPWTMTITLGTAIGTSTVSGTWTLTPAAGILSTITTHQATICTATSTTCQPTSSTTF
jgi:hypothetical protein